MSCVVGVADPRGRRVWVGADSASVGEGNIEARPGKVFRKSEYVIGFVGSWRVGQVIEHSATLPHWRPDGDSLAFMVRHFVPAIQSALAEAVALTYEMGLLVGVAGELFVVDDELAVTRANSGKTAIGSGSHFALGALAAPTSLTPRQTVDMALGVAADLCQTVCPPFHILSPSKESK